MLTEKQRAMRVVGIVYILTGGSTEASASLKDIMRYAVEHRVFEMTDEEFQAHVRPHVMLAQSERGES
jgi:hypothetical protein